MAQQARVIENPLSGERITIRETAAETGGAALVWELVLAVGGQVPSSHAHPRQEELFTVLEGRMRFRIGARTVTAGPGETVRVPPGAVHHFANPGPQAARVAVETRPALDMQALLETAAALATDQAAAGRALPRAADLALFMRDFEPEVRAPYLPAPLVRLVTRAIAWLARRNGAQDRYHRLRQGSGDPGLPGQAGERDLVRDAGR